jgi:hypothetical protein
VHPELIGWLRDGAAATVSHPRSKDRATLVYEGNSIHGPQYEIKTINNFIDDNTFYVLYVSYSILFLKKYTGNICSYEFHF